MDYLPIFVKLTHRHCLVVGGGEVAFRKTQMLLKAGAKVDIIAPEIDKNIARLVEDKSITWRASFFTPSHLDSIFLVVAASNNLSVNAFISQTANERQILVNVVDDTPKCSFIVPSIVDRNPLLIAISSSGMAPVLARLIREKLEVLLPAHLGKMARMAGNFRGRLKEKITLLAHRRAFWEKAFNGRFNRLVASGDETRALQELITQVDDFTLNNKRQSHEKINADVALIGAGPGDPSLLTLRALQLMQLADVVLYDYLVSDEVLTLCRRDAELICVGKRARQHSVSQEKTNALLVKLALAGKRVVRLKGGDPFLFGRGGGGARNT